MVIKKEIKNKISEMAKRRGLSLVVLFGSQARGDAYKNSDIDIAYSSIRPMDFSEENKMAIELHRIFSTPNIDIVNLSNSSPLLLKKITGEGKVLFEARESLFNELYLYTIKVYNESRYLNLIRKDYVLNKINKFKKDIAYVG